MLGFEKFLIEKGYKPYTYVYNKSTKDFDWIEGYKEISSLSNLNNRFVLNDNFDKAIIIGLNEVGKSPTLIYPRPKNISDDDMNKLLNELPNEEIYNLIK